MLPLMLPEPFRQQPSEVVPRAAATLPRAASGDCSPWSAARAVSSGARAAAAPRASGLQAGALSLAGSAAALGLAVGGLRGHGRSARRGVRVQAAKMSMERAREMRIVEQAARDSLDQATPVPKSFDQAVSWACSAVLDAAEAGKLKQTVYFDAGSKDTQVSGAFGAVLPFAERFCKAMSVVLAGQGGRVRVIFSDMGAKSLCESRWEPLPDGMALDYFPPLRRGMEEAVGPDRVRLEELLDADMVIAIVPTQAELPALLYMMKVLKALKKEVPLVLVNARLIQNTSVAAGDLMRQFQSLQRELEQTFHLEQYDPPEKEGLNSAVVARVWPRPFSVWEDNPEDPESVDGFFLLDLAEMEVQSIPAVKSLLESSKRLAQKMLKK